MADEKHEHNVYVFSYSKRELDSQVYTLTIEEYDDRFEIHVSDDPHGSAQIFDFDPEADTISRFRMVSQLINIYLTTPTIEQEENERP